MKSGDRIIWAYTHHTNSRTSFLAIKHGVYIGKIRHTVRYRGRYQLAMVQFDGNKRVSRVPYDSLERETDSGKP